MIAGVQIKELRLIPDNRGFLMEILRSDDAIFEKFGQVYITGCKSGAAKAWHYHKEQYDHFCCVAGKALVVLYDMRKDSKTYGAVEEYVLDAPPCLSQKPVVLRIPPFVVHGFTALDCEEARIVNVPTLMYRYDNPDEFRFQWNSPEIPYHWPNFVRMGG